MQCKDVMSEFVECVAIDDPVCEAASKMKDIDAGFLPVIDPDQRRIVGTFTDRDIAVRVVAENKPLDTPVSEVMTGNPVVCKAEDDVERARQLMSERKISRMIVMEDSRVAGIISFADLSGSAPPAGSTLSQVKCP